MELLKKLDTKERLLIVNGKFDLVCPHRKPNPYKRMAKATQEHRTLPNSLERDFRKGIPGLALLNDITYLPYGRSEPAYLSTILDASTGEILSYNLSNRLTLDIATDTIDALVNQRQLKLHKDAFIHSNQRSHYTSPKSQELLKQKGLGQSMSRRGNCWDNVPQESFFDHRSYPDIFMVSLIRLIPYASSIRRFMPAPEIRGLISINFHFPSTKRISR